MTYLALGSWPDNGARYRLCFVDQGLSLIRKFLSTPMAFTLGHVWLVNAVGHRLHSWVPKTLSKEAAHSQHWVFDLLVSGVL